MSLISGFGLMGRESVKEGWLTLTPFHQEDGDIGKKVPAEGKGGLGRMGIRNDSQFCFGLCGLKCW